MLPVRITRHAAGWPLSGRARQTRAVCVASGRNPPGQPTHRCCRCRDRPLGSGGRTVQRCRRSGRLPIAIAQRELPAEAAKAVRRGSCSTPCLRARTVKPGFFPELTAFTSHTTGLVPDINTVKPAVGNQGLTATPDTKAVKLETQILANGPVWDTVVVKPAKLSRDGQNDRQTAQPSHCPHLIFGQQVAKFPIYSPTGTTDWLLPIPMVTWSPCPTLDYHTTRKAVGIKTRFLRFRLAFPPCVGQEWVSNLQISASFDCAPVTCPLNGVGISLRFLRFGFAARAPLVAEK